MGLYNFQPRFVPFILDGRKTHTIRARRRRPDKVGSMLHLYTGLRTKKAHRLLVRRCVKVEEIAICDDAENGIFGVGAVFVDGQLLSPDEREQLARRDGFADWKEMLQWWDGRLPFFGHIIHWRNE